MGVETALLATTLLNTGYSVYSANKQRKEAKKLVNQENEVLEEQKKQADETRKNQIDAMREQLITSENKLSRAPSYAGVKGIITSDLIK